MNINLKLIFLEHHTGSLSRVSQERYYCARSALERAKERQCDETEKIFITVFFRHSQSAARR